MMMTNMKFLDDGGEYWTRRSHLNIILKYASINFAYTSY